MKLTQFARPTPTTYGDEVLSCNRSLVLDSAIPQKVPNRTRTDFATWKLKRMVPLFEKLGAPEASLSGEYNHENQVGALYELLIKKLLFEKSYDLKCFY